ncbi:Uncharacterised protein [Mycobacteroides abscessus subsp. massiliense]|nr:Uncharacterised protein [Mycobacteroides abscessus subsp. massiliense]
MFRVKIQKQKRFYQPEKLHDPVLLSLGRIRIINGWNGMIRRRPYHVLKRALRFQCFSHLFRAVQRSDVRKTDIGIHLFQSLLNIRPGPDDDYFFFTHERHAGFRNGDGVPNRCHKQFRFTAFLRRDAGFLVKPGAFLHLFYDKIFHCRQQHAALITNMQIKLVNGGRFYLCMHKYGFR